MKTYKFTFAELTNAFFLYNQDVINNLSDYSEIDNTIDTASSQAYNLIQILESEKI